MKKIFLLVLTAALCLPLICCGKAGNSQSEASDGSEQGGSEQGGTSAKTYKEVFDPETDNPNNESNPYVSLLSSDDAYYYPGPSADYLYYFDKVTGERDVLCSKPECTHDQENNNSFCNGYIDAFNGQSVHLYRGKIYFFQDTADFPVYRMNPDSTEREKLFDLGTTCDLRYIPQRTAIHRGKLYGMNYSYVVIDGEPEYSASITCWDLETGEFKLIYEELLPERLFLPSWFFFGDYLYFCSTFSNWEDIDEETSRFIDNTLRIYRFDTKTEELETILDVTDPELYGSRFTLWVEAEDKIYTAPSRGSVGETLSLYLAGDGKLQKVCDLGSQVNIALFEDRILAFQTLGLREKQAVHFKITDYEGNVYFDDGVSIENVVRLAQNKTDGIGAIAGAYYADNAFFIAYSYKYGTRSQSCMIRYELIDGSIGQTLIAISKWD